MKDMNETMKLDFDTFLLKAATLDGNDFSLYVYNFCKDIQSANDREQQLAAHFKKSNYGYRRATDKLLNCIHPDKHASTTLTSEQMSVISNVTVLIYALRVIGEGVSPEDSRDDFDNVVKVSRRCDIFDKDQSDYESIKKMEQYCFTILYNRGSSLPRDWIDALTQQYHNLYVYITYWCKERNAIWLNDNLSLFKYHVKLVRCYFNAKPKLQKVFEDFLLIEETKDIYNTQVKLLECIEDKNDKSSNAFIHARTTLFAALSVALLAAGPVSWTTLVVFSIFRTVLAATSIFATEMIDSAQAHRAEHFSKWLDIMKKEFTMIQNGMVSLEKFEQRRFEEHEWIVKKDLELLPILIEECQALKAQVDISPEEKALIIELEKDIVKTQVNSRLSFFSSAEERVASILSAAGISSDSDSDLSDDSSVESEKYAQITNGV